MQKRNVVHLFNFNSGSRYHALISQGLITHSGINASFNQPVMSLGKVTAPASDTIEKDLCEADIIFRPDDEHFGLDNLDSILDKENLWNRVIYYDKKDKADLDLHRLSSCKAYIKRSWPIGYDREPRPETPRPIIPMDYGLLHEYFTVDIANPKDIDVAYLFPATPIIGQRRYAVYEELYAVKQDFANPVIGFFTTAAAAGRRAIFEAPQQNPFIAYISILKRAKIVFTAYPDNHDGDSRTWEAFSSGGLVCMDATAIPSPHPFVNNEHCIIYDARKRDSIKEAIEKAKYYLNHEPERKKLALAGYKHAVTHHLPLRRMEWILSQI
jgi:hypothetical protein